MPTPTDRVSVQYEGRLTDGTVFDSTKKRGGVPATFPLNGVIKCWTEGVGRMKVGEKAVLTCPSDDRLRRQRPPADHPGRRHADLRRRAGQHRAAERSPAGCGDVDARRAGRPAAAAQHGMPPAAAPGRPGRPAEADADAAAGRSEAGRAAQVARHQQRHVVVELLGEGVEGGEERVAHRGRWRRAVLLDQRGQPVGAEALARRRAPSPR